MLLTSKPSYAYTGISNNNNNNNNNNSSQSNNRCNNNFSINNIILGDNDNYNTYHCGISRIKPSIRDCRQQKLTPLSCYSKNQATSKLMRMKRLDRSTPGILKQHSHDQHQTHKHHHHYHRHHHHHQRPNPLKSITSLAAVAATACNSGCGAGPGAGNISGQHNAFIDNNDTTLLSLKKHQLNHKQQQRRFSMTTTKDDTISDKITNKFDITRIQSDNQDKHLVRTISDLPIFVTIENYRVASYFIGGEPYLCFSQCASFLKEKFSIEELEAKIVEDNVILFDADAKQLEGFIKSSCLKPEATQCKMIKRSDVDRICLRLYEELLLRNKINRRATSCIVNLSSKQHRKQQQFQDNKREDLFDTQAQSSILNFARAGSSTLMIKIYHRCFGKCIGYFYPSLLKDRNQIDCIECTTCKMMMEPRRFIGHTHGNKERDICHWGFNSYNWYYYLSLSKKQTMNNLDEEELLNQFSILASLGESQSNSISSISKQALESSSGRSMSCMIEYPPVTISPIATEASINITKPPIISPPKPPAHIYNEFYYPPQSMATSMVTQPLPKEPPSQLSYMSRTFDYPPPPPPPPSASLSSMAAAVSTRAAMNCSANDPIVSDLRSYLSQSSSSTSTSSLAALSTNWSPPQLGSHLSAPKPLTNTQAGSVSGHHQFTNSQLANTQQQQSMENFRSMMGYNHNDLTKHFPLSPPTWQELYVCTNLSSHLNRKGLSPSMTSDIVEKALNLIRESRLMPLEY